MGFWAKSYTLWSIYNSHWLLLGVITEFIASESEERNFVDFRRKVRSAAIERLLSSLHFTGRLSIVLQNGHGLKSGYEEGYFRSNGRS